MLNRGTKGYNRPIGEYLNTNEVREGLPKPQYNPDFYFPSSKKSQTLPLFRSFCKPPTPNFGVGINKSEQKAVNSKQATNFQ
jgi:hypothetical protein